MEPTTTPNSVLNIDSIGRTGFEGHKRWIRLILNEFRLKDNRSPPAASGGFLGVPSARVLLLRHRCYAVVSIVSRYFLFHLSSHGTHR